MRLGNLGPWITLFALLVAGDAATAAPSRLAGELDAKGLSSAVARERGRVVLVNFWATWCVPCREEFPSLVRLQKAHGTELRVLGVSTDFVREMPAVEKFLSEQSPNFPNYRKKSGGDDQDFIEAVDASWGGELPFSVLYGRDGRKLKVLSGKQSLTDFEREVRKALGR
jgi:thiol-disulfide isomerase/thioredoxin